MSQKVSVQEFKGIKNDTDPKQTGMEYFADVLNFAFADDSILGIEKVKCPQVLNLVDNAQIDGIFEYRFLDSNNILRTKIIVVCNGSIYETDFITNKLIKSGLKPGKCSFAVYQDRLYISNGIDAVQVYYGNEGIVSEMGSPAVSAGISGGITGTYRYALTYITNGGEEVVGTYSNQITVTDRRINVILPIGYDGVTARKLYRTKAGGDKFYFVQDISDNNTREIVDYTGDGYLSQEIPAVNNEMPRPRYLNVAGNKLFGAKVAKYPTQVFVTDAAGDLFDAASFIDVSNYGDDNTPVEGMGEDFNKILVGSGRNIFSIDPADNSVVVTRANVGILNGDSVVKCPSFGQFSGGLMFVSSQKDVRLVTQQNFQTVTISLGNITTQNFAQNIYGTFPKDITSYKTLSAVFYKYRYMLQIDDLRYVFDIRNSAWTKQLIRTDNFTSKPTFLAVISGELINGQENGYTEREYARIRYRDEEVPAYLESVQIQASTDFKVIEKLYFWLEANEKNNMNIRVVCDGNEDVAKDETFKYADGAYDYSFSDGDYTENKYGLDYRIYNINKTVRWLKYRLTVTQGSIILQNFEIAGQQISNKE